MKSLLIVLGLVGTASGAGRVVSFEFEADVVQGDVVHPDPAVAPDAWGALRKGNAAKARAAFAAAATAVEAGERDKIVAGWLVASVLAGDEPDKVVAGFDAVKATPAEKARWEVALVETYRAYGELGRARAARAAILKAGKGDAALHLAAARDAWQDLDWKTLDAELEAALKAAPADKEVQAAVLEHATALHRTFVKTREPTLGSAAKGLYARYTSIAGIDATEAKKQAAELDAALADTGKKTGPQVLGSLDKEIVRRQVRARVAEVSGCYDRALLADEKLEGTLVLTFKIDAKGAVVSAAAKDGGKKLGGAPKCIEEHARKWRFPPTVGSEYNVTYPFELKK